MFEAWREFSCGKSGKPDVLEFERRLVDDILSLHEELLSGRYHHGVYDSFFVNDPKRRHIHKASVRDRVLHHALYRKLYPYFDARFIADSYSCRNGKGTHLAMNRFRDFTRRGSLNHSRTCWVLKCDIRKFFASINREILLSMVDRCVVDKRLVALIAIIVRSFPAGLPLGNLTSQLLANVYMNEFDQFVKHRLRIQFYVRYADDFVFLHYEKQYLECLIPVIEGFLATRLRLHLHPDKVFIKTFASGVDFLGWVHFSDHRVLRTATKNRMFLNMGDSPSKERVTSYRGLCFHGNAVRITNGFPPTRE